MGQYFELTFLSRSPIKEATFKAKLSELGLILQEASSILDWVEWVPSVGRQIRVAAHASEWPGMWEHYFAGLGFDSGELRKLISLEERKTLVNDFLNLGRRLWAAFPFHDGTLAPEEGGPSFFALRQLGVHDNHDVRKKMRGVNFANFLSAEAAEFARIHEWVAQVYPKASVQSLPREGFLVIWDSSKEGLAEYLNQEFSV